MTLGKTVLGAVFVCIGTLGCSDPAPPIPKAAMSVIIGTSPAGMCQFGSHDTAIPGPEYTNGPTATNGGTRIVDGEGSNEVSCKVVGSTSLSISGRMKGGFNTLDMNGNIPQAGGGTGTGRISFTTQKTAGNILAAAPDGCTFTTVQAKAGAVWAKFNCPEMKSQQSTICAANGIFLFENCEQ